MKINLIIPTCSISRFGLLLKTIESIYKGTYLSVCTYVVCDGNFDIHEKIKELDFTDVVPLFNSSRKDWVYSVNRVIKHYHSDFYLYASDDIEFKKDTIRVAMDAMNRYFPDGDGVVNIGRKGRATFGLFGQKLANRFPHSAVFCPDFIHFGADSELFRTVKELGRIYHIPEEYKVTHHRKKDETYRLARSTRERDLTIFRTRRELGYKWGIDFNLVKGK